MKKITDEEVKVFSRYIYEISGIVLDKSKGYLLETRLRPLMKDTKAATFSEFFYQVKSDPSERLKHKIIDAISTNETFFFRDSTPFDLLRNKILPDLIDRRRQYKSTLIPLRIWSAACSSGQEVYSIAMTLKEMLPNLNAYNISIIGSDISDKVIAQASYGKYSRFEVERGLPKAYLPRYFNQMGSEWRIKDEIRAMAQFKKINLLKPFQDIGKFDIIFCRNVAIYFSQADRRRMFGNFFNVLEADGALLLGGSESLSGMNLPFVSNNYLKGIYYQKSGWEKAVAGASLSGKTLPPVCPSTPIAQKAPFKPKSVSEPIATPIQTKKTIPRPGPGLSQTQPFRTPASFSSKTVVVPDPLKVSAKDGSPLPVSPRLATGSKQPKSPRPQDVLIAGQQPESKKSLLSTLHENNKASKPQLTTVHADAAALSSGNNPKISLLDQIASRHKDKGKKNTEKE